MLLVQLSGTGDYKSRMNAIEQTQKLLSQLTDCTPVVPHLSALVRFARALSVWPSSPSCAQVKFLATLLIDDNFTILLTTLQIVDLLVAKVGREIKTHLRHILPRLIEVRALFASLLVCDHASVRRRVRCASRADAPHVRILTIRSGMHFQKFADSYAVVRQTNTKLFCRLVRKLSPAPIMGMLLSSMAHESGYALSLRSRWAAHPRAALCALQQRARARGRCDHIRAADAQNL